MSFKWILSTRKVLGPPVGGYVLGVPHGICGGHERAADIYESPSALGLQSCVESGDLGIARSAPAFVLIPALGMLPTEMPIMSESCDHLLDASRTA